jgi:hypothetical protein
MEWAKRNGFRVIKDRVTRDAGVIRRRTYTCSHSRSYDSVSTKILVQKNLLVHF